MTTEDTGRLIDLVAAELRSQLSEEAADGVATAIVGEITSRFLLIPLPPEEATQAPARGGRPSA